VPLPARANTERKIMETPVRDTKVTKLEPAKKAAPQPKEKEVSQNPNMIEFKPGNADEVIIRLLAAINGNTLALLNLLKKSGEPGAENERPESQG